MSRRILIGVAYHYDPPDGHYTSIIPSGTHAFAVVVSKHFGFRVEIIRDKSRCNSTRSEHCECRACDFFVTAPKGRPMFDWAIAHADELGIQSVIHNRRVWGFGNWTERAYHGPSPHTDHVHIGLNKLAAATLTEKKVKATLGGVEEDWFDMATKEDLREVVAEELEKVIGAVLYPGGTVLNILTEKNPETDKYEDGVKAIRRDIKSACSGG